MGRLRAAIPSLADSVLSIGATHSFKSLMQMKNQASRPKNTARGSFYLFNIARCPVRF
jgi:hypothetical protein